MKTAKLFLAVALISTVAIFSSCESKSEKIKAQLITELKQELSLTPEQEQAQLDSINEELWYQSDLVRAEENQPKLSIKFFKKEKSKIFFVKKWNTPDYSLNGELTGCFWDGNIFYGHKIGDRVYYLDEHKTSKKYFQKTGDSIIFSERYFPSDGVTTDPRQTCWWVNSIMNIVVNDSTEVNLEQFVQEATSNRNNPEFNNYMNKIQNEILSMKGKDIRRKIINYTAQKLPGSKESWDAWEWPGYY